MQAILSALVAIGPHQKYRIISKTPSDVACTGMQDDFDGRKWTKYECVNGKGTKTEYDIIDGQVAEQSEDEVLEGPPRDIDWKHKKAAEEYRREMEVRESRMMEKQRRDKERMAVFQKRQRDEMRRRAQQQKEKQQSASEQKQQKEMYQKHQKRMQHQQRKEGK